MRLHNGWEKRDFATALAQECQEPLDSDARYYAEGRYTHLLREWQAYYPLGNFLILLSDDLIANPLAQVRRVFKWLDVDDTVPISIGERLNMARYSRNPRVVEFLNHPPMWLSKISKQLWQEPWQRRRIRHQLRQRFQSTYRTLPTLDPIIASDLHQRYRGEILALSKVLGRYLSHWLAEEEMQEVPLAQMAY
jgi:hypothetical protein